MKRLVLLSVLALTATAGCANEETSTESGEQAATASAPLAASAFTTPKGTLGTFTFDGPERGAARITILTLSRAGKTVVLECGLSGETLEPQFGAECRLRGGAAWWPFPIPREEGCNLQINSDPSRAVILAASCQTSRLVKANPAAAPKLTQVALTQPQKMLLELVDDASAWKATAKSTGAQIARGPLTVSGTPNTDPVAFAIVLGDAAKRAVGKTLPFAAGASAAAKAGSCKVTEAMLYPHSFGVGDPTLAVHTAEGEAIVRAEGTRTDDGSLCQLMAVMSWRGAGGWVADATTLDARVAQASYRSQL